MALFGEPPAPERKLPPDLLSQRESDTRAYYQVYWDTNRPACRKKAKEVGDKAHSLGVDFYMPYRYRLTEQAIALEKKQDMLLGMENKIPPAARDKWYQSLCQTVVEYICIKDILGFIIWKE